MALHDDQHKGECNHIAASKNKISETCLKMRFMPLTSLPKTQRQISGSISRKQNEVQCVEATKGRRSSGK